MENFQFLATSIWDDDFVSSQQTKASRPIVLTTSAAAIRDGKLADRI